MAVGCSEAETFWTEFLRTLARRGLRGVKLVISDAHEGLKAAIAKVLNATWQRCRVHFMRNLLAHAGHATAAGSPPPSSPPSSRRTSKTAAKSPMAQGRRPDAAQTAETRRLHGRGRG